MLGRAVLGLSCSVTLALLAWFTRAQTSDELKHWTKLGTGVYRTNENPYTYALVSGDGALLIDATVPPDVVAELGAKRVEAVLLTHHHRDHAGAAGVLAERLGPVWDDTVVMVMSEFGRTVRQNGNGGTDHGHGNVMWLMGGAVRGGKVHGRWPGLSPSALHEGRDLAVTTDFRQVVAEVMTGHPRLPAERLQDVLPGWTAGGRGDAMGLIRA